MADGERRDGMTDVLIAISGIDGKIDLLNERFDSNDKVTQESRDMLQGKDGLVATVAVHDESITTLKNNKRIDRIYSTGTGLLGGLLGVLGLKLFGR